MFVRYVHILSPISSRRQKITNMTKQEFLDELGSVLSDEIGQRAAREHVRYYDEYISARVRQGDTQEAVLRQLGSPRLIARSIIEAGQNTREDTFEQTVDVKGASSFRVRKVPAWLVILLVVLAIVSIFSLLVLFVWWLAPIIFTVWVVVFLVKLIGNAGRK